MAEISPSLLLSDAAAPEEGVNAADAKYWPGGDLSVIATGTFDSASLQLVMTVNMPPNGEIPADPSDWMEDADWIDLGDPITGQGLASYGNINPCVLAVKTASPGVSTAVKLLIV